MGMESKGLLMDDAVVVEELRRWYGNLEAVRGVSLRVARGEIFGFLGPNGAGKTTTIHMLCTILRPSAGGATVNGFDIVRERNQVRRSIGLVFQESTLDEYLTAEQNLRFHAYAYGVPSGLASARMDQLLTLVELSDRRGSMVRSYSGGMKRRLEIARGLIHHPQVLFLDEPTLGLDPQSRRRVWEYLRELRQREQLTIFLTTHYMDEAENCDRIAIIDHGQIVALDTPDALKDVVGGDLVTLRAANQRAALTELQDRYGVEPVIEDGILRFTVPRGEEFLPSLVRGFTQPLLSVGIRRPTLDDVFVHLTGHEIRDQELDEREQFLQRRRRW